MGQVAGAAWRDLRWGLWFTRYLLPTTAAALVAAAVPGGWPLRPDAAPGPVAYLLLALAGWISFSLAAVRDGPDGRLAAYGLVVVMSRMFFRLLARAVLTSARRIEVVDRFGPLRLMVEATCVSSEQRQTRSSLDRLLEMACSLRMTPLDAPSGHV